MSAPHQKHARAVDGTVDDDGADADQRKLREFAVHLRFQILEFQIERQAYAARGFR